MIEEQPDDLAPIQVEVTPEAVRINTQRVRRGPHPILSGRTTVDVTQVVYFNSIGRIQVGKKRRWFVNVLDETGELRLRVVTSTEARAKLLADALESLRMTPHTP